MLSPAVARGAIPEIDEEFLAEVARTAPGLAARCPHLPMLADLPPIRARARLHWALTAYLLGLCGRAPVILFVDDLQWTDEPSLDFLLDFVIHQAERTAAGSGLVPHRGSAESHVRSVAGEPSCAENLGSQRSI